MDSRTLYQRVLGEDYARLSAVLQSFHGLPQGGCASGVLEVQHGAGVLRRLAAQLLMLPRAGESVPLRLQIETHDGRETWVRHFSKQKIETLQWQDGPFLIEQAGPIQIVFKLQADEQCLVFHARPNRIRGIPIPGCLSLRVEATARGLENCWIIEVKIALPLLGTIVTYQGEITPQLC